MWQRQETEPLFEDLLWSRPENRRHAGKLLIIGGSAGQFTNVSTAYAAADRAGAGHIRILLPESLRKLTQAFENIEYATANVSGSFDKNSLGIMNDLSDWADYVLLAGDFGKNSETTTVLDGYLLRCPLPTTITENALGSISLPIVQMASRPILLTINSMALQKIPTELEMTTAITSTMNIDSLAGVIADLTSKNKFKIISEMKSKIWASAGGRVVSTNVGKPIDFINLSSYASVWLMQQPAKPLEALATACYEVSKT
jgi:ADP-dependent NAD(P)H-hydrate dehydratase / NAD(P)H-hydrate epimerase